MGTRIGIAFNRPVALEPRLDYSIERAGDLKSMVFGGI